MKQPYILSGDELLRMEANKQAALVRRSAAMKKMVGEKRKAAMLRKNRLDEEAKRLERHRNTFGEFGSSQDQPDESQNATGGPVAEDQNGPHANESEAPEPPPEKRRRITSKTKDMQVAAKIKVPQRPSEGRMGRAWPAQRQQASEES